MKIFYLLLLFIIGCSHQKPPFDGTCYIDKDILTSTDSTYFIGINYIGIEKRTMFDRRVNNWINIKPYIFNAKFSDGLSSEIQVNPEFGSIDSANVQAFKYGKEIGRLPTILRKDVATVWIHKGNMDFGGGNNNILIHTDMGEYFIDNEWLGEVLLHEGVHTSLDAYHKNSIRWKYSQIVDNNYISSYAKENPEREDLAESFVAWYALRYTPNRISKGLQDTILNTIPNRIKYFDKQFYDLKNHYFLKSK